VKSRIKLNIVLILIMAAILGGGGWYINQLVNEQRDQKVVEQASMLMEQALAVRAYTVQHIKPELDARLSEKVLPQTVPAFAATETFENFRKVFPAFRYKEAVLNPTNPRDLAADHERAIIEKFVANPELKEQSGVILVNLKRVYYVAKPIRITNPACLVCHDTPERAPTTQLAVYGEKNGFGWKLNEVVGAQVASVTASERDEQANQLFLTLFGLLAAALLVVLITINVLIGRGEGE
jgi:hypothetical protein